VGSFQLGAELPLLVRRALPRAKPTPADDALARLRCIKTPHEVQRIRLASRVAGFAYREAAAQLEPGLSEAEVAALFRVPLLTAGIRLESVSRADGFAFCMSGPRAAQAYGAYQLSSARAVAAGEPLLVHVNSTLDGYWTDVTRTFWLGEIAGAGGEWLAAVLEARDAALLAIRPGARARDVDAAAREVLAQRGYGAAFRHPTGHGVGFAAIDHAAWPRVHPCSDDVLEAGMVFNVEPGIYIEGEGAVRHCDVVAVSESGAEVLTQFQSAAEDLVLQVDGGLSD
jgi:Xaa-Pro aminopeptidase/Xaa-Pro dipeptidase